MISMVIMLGCNPLQKDSYDCTKLGDICGEAKVIEISSEGSLVLAKLFNTSFNNGLPRNEICTEQGWRAPYRDEVVNLLGQEINGKILCHVCTKEELKHGGLCVSIKEKPVDCYPNYMTVCLRDIP